VGLLISGFFFFLLVQDEKEVEVGEDATLDCQGPHEGNILWVAWTKSDLKADDYVFFFREDRLYKTYQHELFKGRVELEDPNMKSGKMSIILHNITVNDAGTYECHISYETDHINTTVHTNFSVGEDATLDCQGPHEGNILRVAWTKSDLKADDYVFFFREDRLYKTYQHELFKGRVELEDPNMKNGKMSIILQNTTVNDTGTYECHISYETDHSQRSEMKQETKLKVTPAGEVKPRVCPLYQFIAVLEWRRPEFESNKYVFFFRNGRSYENDQHESFKGRVELKEPTMKDGDISVTLKNLSISDAGTYQCRILFSKSTDELKCFIKLNITASGESAC
uniref:Ig-like domain-containing protein n=1 Tax=Oreochromis niloticus TaxID=8128 RepID=A0A669CWF8_ORENI